MNTPISSWVTHAGREPADIVIREMDAWWRHARESQGPEALCRWRGSSLHSLVLVHIDRAAHKRRHQPTFVCKTPCGLAIEDHGITPMSMIVRDDAYGPQHLRVVHSEPESALGHAIAMVKGAEATLAVALASEAEFDDPDFFDLHRASLVDPLRDGVALAMIHVPLEEPESTDDAMAREDLLRAAGYAAYTMDLDGEEDDRSMHRHFAGLLEDVFDEMAGIKADAAARVLMSAPLWPAVVIRTSQAWRRDHGAPAVTGEIPVTSSH